MAEMLFTSDTSMAPGSEIPGVQGLTQVLNLFPLLKVRKFYLIWKVYPPAQSIRVNSEMAARLTSSDG